MKKSLNFLTKLKKNNKTEWMHAHKDEYFAAKEEFEFLVQELIVNISSWDSKLPYMEPKQCTFRLNRDVRFSDNKKPYKDNFGALFAYGGKKGGLPGYYLHISPGEIFVAGGLWMPEADKLIQVRRHIVRHGEELTELLKDKTFKKTFSGLSTENSLKRSPKGFEDFEEYQEFLKLKSFIVSASFKKEDALKPGFGKLVAKHFKVMKPLNEFLNQALKNSI